MFENCLYSSNRGLEQRLKKKNNNNINSNLIARTVSPMKLKLSISFPLLILTFKEGCSFWTSKVSLILQWKFVLRGLTTFIPASCVLFLTKLRLPKNKSLYDVVYLVYVTIRTFLTFNIFRVNHFHNHNHFNQCKLMILINRMIITWIMTATWLWSTWYE